MGGGPPGYGAEGEPAEPWPSHRPRRRRSPIGVDEVGDHVPEAEPVPQAVNWSCFTFLIWWEALRAWISGPSRA